MLDESVDWSVVLLVVLLVVMSDDLLVLRIGNPRNTRFPLTFGNCDYFSPRFLFGTLLLSNLLEDIACYATPYPWDRPVVRSGPRRTRPGCKLFCGTVLDRIPCRGDTVHLSVHRVVNSLWLLWWWWVLLWLL